MKRLSSSSAVVVVVAVVLFCFSGAALGNVLENFMTWAGSHDGSMSPAVTLRVGDDGEIGLVANRDIPQKQVIAETYKDIWITAERIREKTSLGQFLEKMHPQFFQDPALEDYVFALYLLHCRFVKKEKCFHYPFVMVLHGNPHHPVQMPLEQLHPILQDHFVYDPIVMHTRSLYDSLWNELSRHMFPQNRNLFPEQAFTRYHMDWAYTAVVKAKQPLDPELGMFPGALIPFLNFVRYRPGALSSFGDRNVRRLMTYTKPLEKGEEFFIDEGKTTLVGHYLKHANVPDNIYNMARIHAPGVIPLKDPHLERKKSLLQQHKVPHSIIFDGDGELVGHSLKFLRVLYSNSTEELDIIDAFNLEDTGDDAIEAELHSRIAAGFHGTLRSRPSPDSDRMLLLEPELLTEAQRRLVKLRRHENQILFKAFKRFLGPKPIPDRIWYDQRAFMTSGDRI